ncbi:MAG: hypothetical protein HZB91_08990 [Elusimicrobia bacterium]|nr:hypothetical protein [Elusimicrobiota bacterium]
MTDPDQSPGCILYVWDNNLQSVAGAYQEVREGGPPPCADVTGTFPPSSREAFRAELLSGHPAPRFAVGEWAASSLEEFYRTRYGWTDEDFEESRRQGPPPIEERASGVDAALSLAAEIEVGVLGQKTGAPADRDAFRKELEAEMVRRQTVNVSDVPLCWGRLTVPGPAAVTAALALFIERFPAGIGAIQVPPGGLDLIPLGTGEVPLRVTEQETLESGSVRFEVRDSGTKASTLWTIRPRRL